MQVLKPIDRKTYLESRAKLVRGLVSRQLLLSFAKELKRLRPNGENELVKRNRQRFMRHYQHLLYQLAFLRHQYYGARFCKKKLTSQWAAVQPLVTIFSQTDHPLFLVGGAVRDHFLSAFRTPNDFDLVTSMSFEATAEVLSAAGFTVFSPGVSKKFGILFVRYPYLTTTQEAQIQCGVEHLSNNLSERDFTINSLAINLTGTWHPDNYFTCVQDIKKGVVRCALDPLKTLSSDPVRMLRAYIMVNKLQQDKKGSYMDPSVRAAIRQLAPMLATTNPSRLGVQIVKLFSCENLTDVLRELQSDGVLHQLFPEMSCQIGFNQKNPHHHLPLWEHTLAVVGHVEKLRGSWRTKLAAFLHDVAKPYCNQKQFKCTVCTKERLMENMSCECSNKDGWTFVRLSYHGHDRKGAEMARVILNRLGVGYEDSELIVKMIECHQKYIRKEPYTVRQARRFLNDMGSDLAFKSMINLMKADRLSHAPGYQDIKVYENLRALIDTIKEKPYEVQLPIDGNWILANTSLRGPKVGTFLNALKARAIDGDAITQEVLNEEYAKLRESSH
jgi:tRNA nucleotidyltransferase/poly(A) polymerase